MKIGVIGAGAVGWACLLSSIRGGIAREIVVVNRERKRAKAVVTDLSTGEMTPLPAPVKALRSRPGSVIASVYRHRNESKMGTLLLRRTHRDFRTTVVHRQSPCRG